MLAYTTLFPEFPIDPTQEGQGALIVTDTALLVRPRQSPNQYHKVNHDTAHAASILMLGNDMGLYRSTIVSSTDPETTHRLLDRVFYAFVDGCCFELWCDAVVYYFDGDRIVRKEEYGSNDSRYTMFFDVHCNVAPEETEEFVGRLLRINIENDPIVLVYADTSAEDGYAIKGFASQPVSRGEEEEEPEQEED